MSGLYSIPEKWIYTTPFDVVINNKTPFLFPYHCHDAGEEYGRKIHVSLTGDKALCGFSHGAYSSLVGNVVGEKWLNQPGQGQNLCQKCRKIALKEYFNNGNKSNN